MRRGRGFLSWYKLSERDPTFPGCEMAGRSGGFDRACCRSSTSLRCVLVAAEKARTRAGEDASTECWSSDPFLTLV
jgi:hypothetical protein